jgi:hypothetical protein
MTISGKPHRNAEKKTKISEFMLSSSINRAFELPGSKLSPNSIGPSKNATAPKPCTPTENASNSSSPSEYVIQLTKLITS